MLHGSCHCGAVELRIDAALTEVTDCNCSICRRYGVLWAYYKDAEVTLTAAPGATDEYIWGDRMLRFIRCKHCGCIMQWRGVTTGTRTGVNARNFEPAALGDVKIRLLDGADTWRFIA
jgi:hypothetical protein